MLIARARATSGFVVAILLLVIVLSIEALQPIETVLPEGTGGNWVKTLHYIADFVAPNTAGFGPVVIALFDGLLLLTVLFFLGAVIIPHKLLALVQSIAISIWGVIMIFVGALAALFALGKFLLLVAMLLAFPFGTIAYFAKYSCSSPPATTAWLVPVPMPFELELAGNACFDGTMAAIWLTFVMKLAVVAVILLLGFRYARVFGLIFLFVLSSGLALGIIYILGMTSTWSFLLYPVDALLTVGVSILAIFYGVFTFIKGLIALVLAIISQII